MKQKLKLLGNTTSGQIFISSMLVMAIAFLCIGGYLYKNMSGYILQQSSKYIEITVKQAQERFNSSLTEMDSSLQRLCNDLAVQTILNDYNQNASLSSESFSTLRLKTMNTINYADNLESIELYSKKAQIYPYTKEPLSDAIPETALALADEYNGKAVWLLSESESGGGHTIMAVKRILLADYAFEHGGYVVVHLKPDLMDSIAQDLNALGDCTLELTDCAGARVSYGKTLKDMNPEAFERNYQLADSTSSYSGWTFSIYIPKELTSNDISWMSGIVIYGFLIGTGVFLICSLFIARMISKPLSDMRKSMVIADGKLQANDRHYSNSDINELNIHYNALVEKNNCLIEQVFEKEILRTKAEITALQSQVNPHFIINALESVYWSLIQKNDMDNAGILMAMAKLFQYILKGSDRITIDQELTFVEQYLQVEKFRFGDRLTWEYQVEPEVRSIQIPKLLIHPLVENSMKYAVETTSSPVHIVIRIVENGDGCVISVTDNGPGIDQETMERIQESFKNTNPVGSVSGSYGLANLYKRIKLYFEKSSELTIESEPGSRRTTVTMRIHTNNLS